MNPTPQQLQLEKKLNRLSWAVSAVVLLLVSTMHRFKIHTDMDFTFLPPFHASVNAVTALILCYAFWAIKNGKVEQHRKAIYAAMACSALFLLSYVIYHLTNEDTKFGGTGWIRPVYFFILITHIILAALILPFILFTFTCAYTGQFERHRKMARWVFPLWLYVAVTGPICYLLLRPYYAH